MRKPLKVSSRDVARLAGVSQSTVSKVANNNASLTADTRAMVIRAARELGYPLVARNGMRIVAVIVPEQRFLGYVSSMLMGISRRLLARGFCMEIILDTMLHMLNERCIDGAIAISWNGNLSRHWSERLPLPLVRINSPSDHINNCYSVQLDGFHSLQTLIDRLWQLRHRKIGFFFFNSLEHEINNASGRRDGFIAAMRAHGVSDPEAFCAYSCQSRDCEELAALLRQWRREGVTALIFANAMGTGKMMHIIRMLGVRIPEEMSLIGWELEDFSQYTDPPLSTFYPDPVEMAESAVDLLEKLLSHQQNVHDITHPFRWFERQSIAPAPDQGS